MKSRQQKTIRLTLRNEIRLAKEKIKNQRSARLPIRKAKKCKPTRLNFDESDCEGDEYALRLAKKTEKQK